MSGLPWQEITSLAGLVVPALTLVFYFGANYQRLKAQDDRYAEIKTMLTTLLENEVHCKASREDAEDRLHSRVTAIQERTARLEGRLNGVGGHREIRT